MSCEPKGLYTMNANVYIVRLGCVKTPDLIRHQKRVSPKTGNKMNAKTIGIGMMVLMVALIATAGNAAAIVTTTHYVYEGDSIQAAINDAVDGDTIIIADGDYTENVVVNKSVAIISEGVDEYYAAHVDEYERFIFWWLYVGSYDTTTTYSGEVSITAEDTNKDVFLVESDDVLIMNIQVEIDTAGAYVHYYNYQCFWMWCWANNADVITWEYTMFDNPMTLTGATKSDAAGVTVNGATNTELINLITYGNDNGIVLVDAVNTVIQDVEMNNNNKEGLVATSCDGILIYDAVVVDSGKRGIEIEDSANVELDTVLILNSGKDNIELVNVDGVYMFNVVADTTTKNGMSLDVCTDVIIEECAALNSGRSGLYMNACDSGMVDMFEAANNGNYGLKIMYTDNMDFTNIDAHDNDEDIKAHDCTGCTGLPT